METNNCTNPQCFCDGSCKGLVKSDINYSMQTKKVIEQENDIPVIVDHTNSEGNRIFVGSIVGGAYIENSKATEVAKEICPKYQEVEDDRDILQYTLSRVRKFVGAKPGESIEDKFTELKDQNAKVLEALKMHVDSLDLTNMEFYEKYGFNVADVFPRTRQLIQQSETKSKDNE